METLQIKTDLEELKKQLEIYSDYTKRHFITDEKKFNYYDMMLPTYLDRQFEDASQIFTNSEYIRWLKKIKQTFFKTIPTESLIMGNTISQKKIIKRHSSKELDSKVLGNYSPTEIMQILNQLNPLTVMLLIATNVSEVNDDYSHYCLVSGDFRNDLGETLRIYSTMNSIYIPNSLCSNGNKIGSFINQKEFLLRQLKIPILILLNSIQVATNPFVFCQYSKQADYDEALARKILNINIERHIKYKKYR